jgi:RNA polymerase sigma factor (sigma-70 family)
MRRSADPFDRVETLAEAVYAYVAYRIGPGPVAEDITSETFARGVRARATFDPARGNPNAWLVGIARRVIADELARREVPVAEPHERADAHDLSERVVERVTLADGMRLLPERDRELLALRYGGDLTAAQIGRLLDMQTNAVEVALHRALRRLRSTMDDGQTAVSRRDPAYEPTR